MGHSTAQIDILKKINIEFEIKEKKWTKGMSFDYISQEWKTTDSLKAAFHQGSALGS